MWTSSGLEKTMQPNRISVELYVRMLWHRKMLEIQIENEVMLTCESIFVVKRKKYSYVFATVALPAFFFINAKIQHLFRWTWLILCAIVWINLNLIITVSAQGVFCWPSVLYSIEYCKSKPLKGTKPYHSLLLADVFVSASILLSMVQVFRFLWKSTFNPIRTGGKWIVRNTETRKPRHGFCHWICDWPQKIRSTKFSIWLNRPSNWQQIWGLFALFLATFW